MQKEHTFTVDGLFNGGGGGLISEWAYIRNNMFENGWAHIGGGLKSGILRYFRIYLEGLMRTRL